MEEYSVTESGEHEVISDIVTSTAMICGFVNTCGNKNLSVEVVKDAGHMAGMNGMTAILGQIERI